ncbi:MAG: DUF952 domain-containing protein [Candidatus Cyclonatronum sp.]|uniref:DUF952 domain-containing protein n=1 Tax=Cyclonatronum sp. TaxID=3024185 RepID=UPI0025B86195|nr:DUF952 domain-containing protein [Cyclonatronum sp.]MCC5934734.1 DUF952 domain-containing protein [Balneolales bacterium]MCH8486466.1 DUF952 domain-containing protein [Cyclonatronum sp.]
MTVLYYHIAEKSQFEAAQNGIYAPDAYEAEGFVHLCSAAQLSGVYERYYKGRKGLVLLFIAFEQEDFLSRTLILEDLTNSGERFPHYYAPIPIQKIKGHHPLEPRDDDPLTLDKYFLSVINKVSSL